MNYICSMNKKVYEDFGHRLIDTFLKHYIDKGSLYVYSEDTDFNINIKNSTSKVLTRNFGVGLSNFLKIVDANRRLRGRRFNIKMSGLKKFFRLEDFPRIECGLYDYMFDAKRFAFKSFSWIYSIHELSDEFVYLDADCHFFRDFNDQDFLRKIKGDVGFFGRSNYTETGIIYFNNKDFKLLNFGKCLENTYISGHIFNLPAYTDCHVFDFCRMLNNDLLVFQNLSTHPSSHPIAHSYLSNFVDHRKGDRKSKEFSPELKI
jgi:hypothetical protein